MKSDILFIVVFLAYFFSPIKTISQNKIDVPAESRTVISQTYKGGINEGDTLFLLPGIRGEIRFENLRGSQAKPIVVVNQCRDIIVDIKDCSVGMRFVNSQHIKVIGRPAGSKKGNYIHQTQYQGITIGEKSEYIDISGIETYHQGSSTNASVSVKDYQEQLLKPLLLPAL